MPELTLDWKKYKNTAIDIAREGSVLLKNDREALPVSKDSKIALFGRMQGNYYKSGTGSGGMVNVNHVTDIREGLANCPDITLDAELMDIYDKWDEENPFDQGNGWGGEPWSQKEMPLDDEVVKKAASSSSKAVVII